MGMHHWKKYMRATAASVLILSALAACGSPNHKDAEAAPETELTVLLDWYPNAVHSFLYAAEEQGYFAEEGLKVKLQTPADTNDALKLVATGKADLALSYQMQVAISRAEDIPIVSVAAIVRHPLNRLFALDTAGVQSPKDLVGKKIGYPSIPLDQLIVNTMVESDGGDVSKLNYIDIGWDLIPAITTNKVDAIIGGYVNHEKPLLEKEGMKLTAFDPSEFGVPDYYELVLTASEEGLASKSEAFKKFIAAAAKGQQYTAEHPEESLQNLLDSQNENFPLDAEIEKQSLDILLPLMDAGSEPFGSQTADSWNAVIDWLSEHGQLKKEIKAEDAFRPL
ncbi:putative hydroxymethylpyrimidine transport system substrate-binding protein [Paenibacillus endophyticus]|uniref:Putative hydroxymethylpyrimidine transport system substrate-binding protein n=2 Tax=Paenibacillus endophyticus TaxID=1294268 RepID=A0A7W5CAT8_9BACL|nr:ABC transporter substrate-binding protein [Paenibacillus endophyticus]MBB3154288.1 putative hydroxymethylpyrimidine transport system substrate-binding protein [Paenibacillus endophyticus]